MRPRFTALKGVADVLPPETGLWRKIENAACLVMGSYGYDEIKPPVIEQTELFSRSIGDSSDIMAKEMYTFTDKGGRSVSLRPEGTASIVRAYVEHNLSSRPAPQKFFYFGPMFRYERPQKGRQRQFYQLGAECFGIADPGIDAEMITMLLSFLDRIGLKGLSLEINSIGCKECRPAFKERLREFFAPHLSSLCPDCQRRYEQNPLRILDCKVERCTQIRENAPLISETLCEDCKNHFSGLLGFLDAMGAPYILNPHMVRGLDYYTRTVFEVKGSIGLEGAGLGSQNAVAAGGRYDLLVSEFGGPETPATGFAAGMERLAALLKEAGPSGEEALAQGPVLFIASLGPEASIQALKMASRLRQGGTRVELGWGGSLKSQLRRADKLSARYVVIIGEDELKTGRFKWKNLNDGSSGFFEAGEEDIFNSI